MKKNHHPFLSLLFYAVVFSANLFSQNIEPAIDALLMEQFPSDGPGATAIVVKNGEVLYRKAFGMADLELNVPMQPENIFRIGSITKQFTACAILKLMEEGKLSLQDDITKYIPDYPTQGHRITIEHLLTHTSGIKSYTDLDKWTAEERKRDFTPVEMIDYFKDEPMDFAPGEEFSYNNSAYFILGYIIEIISGKTYGAFIEEKFFQPLGMKNSFYGSTSKIIKNRAAGYAKGDEGYVNAPFLSMTQPYAAGSLLSTVDDLNTWYQAVAANKVISEKSKKMAHTSYKLNNGSLTGNGYGWFLGNIQGSPMYEHGGGINGYLSASLFLPEEKIFVAVFSNCNCNPPGDVANKIAAIALGKPLAWEKTEMPSEDICKKYEAVYESEFDGQRIISLEGGKLFSQRTGGPKLEIYPYAKDKFFFEDSFSNLEFIRNEKGEIESVILRSTGLPITWARTDKALPKIEEIKLPTALIEKYIGKYQLAPNFNIAIAFENDKVTAQATGQDPIELFAFEKHKFFAKAVDIKIQFNLDEKDEVTSLTLFQNGEHEAKKIN